MAYKGIDRKRFEYLLGWGASDLELRRFFTECRLQLIGQGGKVQNLPHGYKARLKMLSTELPPSTDKTVRAWFTKNLTMIDPVDVEDILLEYNLYEELGEQMSEDFSRRLARSCLVHLFKEMPPQALVDFLKTPIARRTKDQDHSIQAAAGSDLIKEKSHVAPPDFSKQYPVNFPLLFLDLVEGRDVDEHLEGVQPDLAAYISGLQMAAQGYVNDARKAAEELPANTDLQGYLNNFIAQQEARRASGNKSIRSGLQYINFEPFQGDFECETDEVFAYCTKSDPPKSVFLHAVAIVRNFQIMFLTEDMTRSIFPNTGDLMAFSGPDYPRQPRRGEVGIWRVEEHEHHGRSTHFHLVSNNRHVYEVYTVPFASTEYDSVREYVKEYTERAGGSSLQPPLFLLSDGLIVGARNERPDLSKDETFESGLLSWNSLLAFRHDGRVFVAGPLPNAQGVYECASLASTARKLFKRYYSAGGASGLTKNHYAQFKNLLESADAEFDISRIQRIKNNIERLEEQSDAFEFLVNELSNHQSIKDRIDKIVEQEVSKQIETKKNIHEDIEKLKAERIKLEDRLRKQHEENRKLRDQTSKEVKAAFEKAKMDGMSVLGDLALFQALLGQGAAVIDRVGYADHPPSFLGPVVPEVRELVPRAGEAVSTLKPFGVSPKLATAFALATTAAIRAGLMVCVRGIAARPVVEEWASILKYQGVLIDANVGLIDDSIVKRILTRDPTPEIVVVMDANLSALDIYARPLADFVFARAARTTTCGPVAILLSLTESVGALPIPQTFERISILLDLDERYDFISDNDVNSIEQMITNSGDGYLFTKLWRPLADNFIEQIKLLEPYQRALVLSLISK